MREPAAHAPELSRRARGVEVWAALRALGRAGLADLVERDCRHATAFAEGLSAAGYEILNDVVLNQVLVSFGDEDATRRVVAAIQEDGTCWAGVHGVAGPDGHAHQRLRLGHHRGRRGAQPRGDAPGGPLTEA